MQLDKQNEVGQSRLGGIFAGSIKEGEPTQFGRISPPRMGWLAQEPAEPVLEPGLAIVDTHHHLWDLPGFRYLFDEFQADLDTGHKIVATVFNECQSMYRSRGPEELRPVGEVEFCAGVAAMSASGDYGATQVNAGIVGFADLTLGDAVAPVLETQIAAGGGRFRGVRHAAAWDADPVIGNSHTSPRPGLYGEERFRAGLRRLASYGLSLDAWVFHPQLCDVIALARDCPEVSIVLCHMGGPLGYGTYAGRADEVFSEWRASMTELATCENVTVKLGGVLMRLAAFDYGRSPAPVSSRELAKLWSPYVSTCLELFGPQRCMVESNFPVEKMGVNYRTLWNTFKRMLGELTPDEKALVFAGTAADVYRIDL